LDSLFFKGNTQPRIIFYSPLWSQHRNVWRLTQCL
jgi:hypothetical protein